MQRGLPRAKVVKCFNIVNSATMVHPPRWDGLPDLLPGSDDPAVKCRVARIPKEFGWGKPVDVDGIDGARWLEASVPPWVRIARIEGDRSIALKILRR